MQGWSFSSMQRPSVVPVDRRGLQLPPLAVLAFAPALIGHGATSVQSVEGHRHGGNTKIFTSNRRAVGYLRATASSFPRSSVGMPSWTLRVLCQRHGRRRRRRASKTAFPRGAWERGCGLPGQRPATPRDARRARCFAPPQPPPTGDDVGELQPPAGGFIPISEPGADNPARPCTP